MGWQPPTTKNYLAPNLNSAEVEDPSSIQIQSLFLVESGLNMKTCLNRKTLAVGPDVCRYSKSCFPSLGGGQQIRQVTVFKVTG